MKSNQNENMLPKINLNGEGSITNIEIHNEKLDNMYGVIFSKDAIMNAGFIASKAGNVNIITPFGILINASNNHTLFIHKLMKCDNPITINLDENSKCFVNTVMPGAGFNIKIEEKEYHFNNPADKELIISFGNISKFLDICKNLNEFFISNDFSIIENVCLFKEYQKLDKNAVTCFMEQNKMVSTQKIDHFIDKHFFEIDAIAISLEGSGLLNGFLGNYDPIEEICSYLKLEDVILSGDNPVNQIEDLNT